MTIHTEWVNLPVSQYSMPAFVAHPQNPGPFPAIIVWMEIFGVNSHIQSICTRLAEEGYLAIAHNYFHRQAPDLNLGYDKNSVEEGKKLKALTGNATLMEDGKAVVDFLNQHPKIKPQKHYGSIGFCFGGYAAYLTATLPEIAATASFYGAGIAENQDTNKQPAAIHSTSQIKGNLLVFFGSKDGSIPQSQVQAIEKALSQHTGEHEVVVYPADHGFFCDQRASFHEPSAQSAYQKTLAFFKENL